MKLFVFRPDFKYDGWKFGKGCIGVISETSEDAEQIAVMQNSAAPGRRGLDLIAEVELAGEHPKGVLFDELDIC